MKNTKIYLLIIIIIAILGYLIVSNRIITKKLKYENVKFYNATLDGNLKYISIKQHRISIQLVNDSAEYLFNPESINHSKSFIDIADVDDKIYKPSFSDTLVLIKNGNFYKFNFEKPDIILE